MHTYTYNALPGVPCQPYILAYINYSDMTDKKVGTLTWNDNVLTVTWEDPGLGPNDKLILDAIVTASVGKVRITVAATQIIDDIFWLAYRDGGQARVVRMCLSMNKWCSAYMALCNQNYPLTRGLLGMALAAGDLIQDDYDLMMSVIPESEYE